MLKIPKNVNILYILEHIHSVNIILLSSYYYYSPDIILLLALTCKLLMVMPFKYCILTKV